MPLLKCIVFSVFPLKLQVDILKFCHLNGKNATYMTIISLKGLRAIRDVGVYFVILSFL
jgi:hypothetical protein